MSYGRRTLDMMRKAGQGNKRIVTGAAAGLAAKATGGIASGMGKFATSSFGGTALFGGVASAMAYDSIKHGSMGNYAAQEGLKVGTDAIFETALFAGASLLGPMGTAAAVIGSTAMYMTGTNPGEAIGGLLKDASEAYKKDRGQGPGPITQNARTMRASQQGLRMLGQSRGAGSPGHNMLGSEASYMHN